MPEYNEIIGKKVRDFIREKGISQTKFAELAEVKHPVINRIVKKNDLKNPEYKTLQAIAKPMKLEVWQLLQPPEAVPTTPQLQEPAPQPKETAQNLSDRSRLILGVLHGLFPTLKQDQLGTLLNMALAFEATHRANDVHKLPDNSGKLKG